MGQQRVRIIGLEEASKEAPEKVKHIGKRAAVVQKEEEKKIEEVSKEEIIAEEKPVIAKSKPPRQRSKRYLELHKLIDRSKIYPFDDALDLVKKTSKVNFEAKVEAHLLVEKAKNQKEPVHAVLGKVSGDKKKLAQHYQEVIAQYPANKIKKIYLTSTMGPSVRVEV